MSDHPHDHDHPHSHPHSHFPEEDYRVAPEEVDDRPVRDMDDVFDITEYTPNEEQAQIITILRSIGEMAAQAIPLLAVLPYHWYDWPCAHQRYPHTCNTVPLPEGQTSLPVEEVCPWCRLQAERPYTAGVHDGQNALMLQARAVMDQNGQQEPPPKPVRKATPAKKAAKKAPAKRTAKRT